MCVNIEMALQHCDCLADVSVVMTLTRIVVLSLCPDACGLKLELGVVGSFQPVFLQVLAFGT